MIKSKEWNWQDNRDDHWRLVADEFLPVALNWRTKEYARVLDLGSGLGRNAIYLAKLGFSVSAFDLSAYALSELEKIASTENMDIATQLGDMLNLPYEPGYFDCVLAFHSIYHTDYDGLAKVISEIKRVTKSGGEVFVTFNSKDADDWALYAERSLDDYTLLKTDGPEIDVPHTYVEYHDILNLMKEFEIIKIQQIFDYSNNRKHAHFFVTARKD